MKVKIIRLWPIPVLLFIIYCLYALVSDSNEVLYQERNETDPIHFLVCKELSYFFPNQTEIDLKELRDNLYDHFNSSEIYRLIREIYLIKFEELILNRTKSGNYLILNQRVCLFVNDQKELEDISRFLYRNNLVLFAMNSDTFDFVRMESSSDPIDQKIVQKKEHLSDCDQSNGRFLCLNECFRRRFRLSRYFYQANETGRILLHFSESNRTIQKAERTCFGQCRRENCKLILVKKSKESKSKTETFEAEPVLSAFDFWLQIVGLIFSIVSLFFNPFTSITTKLIRSRIRRKKVKVGLFYLNLAIIILSLAYFGYLCVRVTLDLQAAKKDLREREMTRNLIYPKTVHLAICVYIEKYLEFLYEWKTMLEIERATDEKLVDALEGIYVSDAGRSFRTDYQVHRKILFNGLRRCLPLSIQPNYPTIPSRPILTVRFRDDLPHAVYVLSEEDLNGNSFEYEGWFAFQKRIVKRLKGRGCVDYKAKYENCTGRQNCVERCIARKFIERNNSTTVGVYLHYRDWFSPSEWNTSELRIISDKHQSLYLNVSKECEEKFSEKPCNETKFEKTFQFKQPGYQTWEIDLQFDVVQSAEELSSSLRMALDLLGIQSIFFGFTLLQLFWMVYQFTKPSWRWRLKDKTDKVVWFIVCLLFSLGCSWTTVHMLDGIVNGELVPTEHYELAERVQMPAMVFCFQIDQKLIDRNHRLTGRYLEELTKNITTESTFKSISYLNESNEWAPFDLRRVERFFLFDMKCFRFHIEEKYNRNQFHFSNDTHVLRVNFEWYQLVHFMIQSRETEEFSKFSKLDYVDYSSYPKWRITHEPSLYEHEDRFGFFRRHFPPLEKGDLDNLRKQLLELQGSEPTWRTLSLPVEEEHFGVEMDEDHFEQLYSGQRKNQNKRTNYRQMFVTNHLRQFAIFESDFSFELVFLRRVVHFTNEVNYATLTLALLNLLSLWLELGVLDLRPFLVRLHDHLLVPLYLHLPVKNLLHFHRWLKKLKPQIYELIHSQLKEEEEEGEGNSPDDSSTSDQPSVTSVSSVIPDQSSAPSITSDQTPATSVT